MRRRFTTAVTATLLAAALALLAAPLAAQDARDQYRDGLAALEGRRFDEAARHFRGAIAERGEERVGGLRRDYLPHFYLGVALAEAGDCRGALSAWAESERQGQVSKESSLVADLTRRRDLCQAAIERFDAARGAAEQAVARARKAAGEVAELARTPELKDVWAEGEDSFADRQGRATSPLEEAAASLARIDGSDLDPAVFEEAVTLANRAAADLDALAADGRERRNAIRGAAANALDVLLATEQRAHAALGDLPGLEPLPPELGRRAGEVRRLLDEVVRTKAAASPEELRGLERRLGTALRRLQEESRQPPESLRQAAQAYLDGDYDGVLAALAGADLGDDPRSAAQACLLRAAARHARWVLDGESDAEVERELEENVRQCRRSEAPPIVSPTFFSPRFIRFYDTVPEDGPEVGPGAGSDLAAEAGSAAGDEAAETDGAEAGAPGPDAAGHGEHGPL